MTFNFTTPVGRLVYGSVWEGNDKDFKTGQPRLIKTGPNAGKPRIDWAFGVAFPKVLANGQPNNEFYDFYRNVIEVARGGYPQFFNGQLDNFTGKPGCTHPRMTFKIRDGDGVDADGKQNNQKEGWAGHYIVSFSGSFAPRVFDINVGLAPEQQLQDKTRVLPGDYVSVAGTCEPNIGCLHERQPCRVRRHGSAHRVRSESGRSIRRPEHGEFAGRLRAWCNPGERRPKRPGRPGSRGWVCPCGRGYGSLADGLCSACRPDRRYAKRRLYR